MFAQYAVERDRFLVADHRRLDLGPVDAPEGDTAVVLNIIDGDTIDRSDFVVHEWGGQ